jgi:hypothetical protein
MTVNATVKVLPFGSYESRESVLVAPPRPEPPGDDSVYPAPTTAADQVVTSAPVRVLAD